MIFTGDNGQLFGWPENVWLWLDQAGILLGNTMMLVTLLGGIYAWSRREAIRRWLGHNRFPSIGSELDEAPGHWDALIFTLSNAELPLWVSDTLRPGLVALLGTEATRDVARHIQQELARKGIEVLTVHQISDPDDPAEVRERTAGLIRKLRQMGCESLAVDVTGGKATMSIGAFMAAEEAGIPSLYAATTYSKTGKPEAANVRIRCISCPEEQ